MKKLFSLSLVLVILLVSLVSCGAKNLAGSLPQYYRHGAFHLGLGCAVVCQPGDLRFGHRAQRHLRCPGKPGVFLYPGRQYGLYVCVFGPIAANVAFKCVWESNFGSLSYGYAFPAFFRRCDRPAVFAADAAANGTVHRYVYGAAQ